jgi:hypothetical protein
MSDNENILDVQPIGAVEALRVRPVARAAQLLLVTNQTSHDDIGFYNEKETLKSGLRCYSPRWAASWGNRSHSALQAKQWRMNLR